MPKLRAFRVMIENEAMVAFGNRDPGYGWLTPKLCKLAFHDIDPTMDAKQLNQLVKKADCLKDGIITYDFFIRAMFDDTPPVTKYVPKKRRHPVVQAILRIISCGEPKKGPQHAPMNPEEEDDDATGREKQFNAMRKA